MAEIKCEDCAYYDKENENCRYFSCDGLDCEDMPCGFRMLEDYYQYELGENEGEIIIDGKSYEYEMTLNPKVPDDGCCRVLVDGSYYYFG